MTKSGICVGYSDNSENKRVLITGANGYIGCRLTQEAVHKGWEVLATDISHSHVVHLAEYPNFKFLGTDILELRKKDLSKIDTIFHLASIVGTPACKEDPDEAKRVNLDGTKHLLEIAPEAKIFFTNTNIGYPEGKSDETTPLTATGIYSETKIEAEKLILNAGGVSLRLASVCGISLKMRDDLLLNFLVKQCVENDSIEVFDVESNRNFIHVRDVIDALVRFHPNLRDGEAYNFAIPTHYTKLELLDMIKAELDKSLKVIRGTETDPDKRNYILSIRKWNDHTGSYPRIHIKDAIKELIRYYGIGPL
jgi:nucleoside-diphosphate-sugar epimerase